MKELDCRTLACPQPVLQTKDALEEMSAGQLKVIVDNEAAVGNVSRFAQSQGCTVVTQDEGPDFALIITKEGCELISPEAAPVTAPAPGRPRVAVKISSQVMGSGDDELGRILMKAFLNSLTEASHKPETLVFYNSGVFLTCAGSEHLGVLTTLEGLGVKILSCGTCLDFYHLKDKLGVGSVSNMFEIIEVLSGADRIVSP